jgi:uncharacterized damage-inducible protein DinB
MHELTSTWNIHHRINIYLLDALDEASLAGTASSKGRTVGEQFAHLHNVRLMWLKAAAPDLLEGIPKLEKGNPLTKELLKSELDRSAAAISQLLDRGVAEGRIKGFKPHPTAFLGYLISHESHHRGQIMLSLKQSGHLPDKKILFGIWEWGNK